MTTGAPPRAAVDKHREALELARRRTALQVDTVAHAVTGIDDTVGWSRLTELGTASTVRAQSSAVTATTDLLSATLDAAGVAADLADALPGIEPGRLASGRDVRGMFDRTRDIVQARMAGGAAFPEALDASANVLTAIASSEPHRIARDGQFNVGLSDDRFDKFRRVTVGTSCAFCAMLATRGAVYLTAESAGQSRRYHYKCDCYVELVVDPAAIESSKSTSEDWRKAIKDQERLRAADVRREFADLSDDDLARIAGNRPDSALSADLLAERARRAAAPVPAARIPDPTPDLPTPPARPKYDADSVQRVTNADLDDELTAAWNAGDDDLAVMLEDEIDRRQKWADGWGRTYDDYDDFRPLDPTDLDDLDLPNMDDIPDPPAMTRRQVREQWEADQELRYMEAEGYGGGILPELQSEAARKGITMSTLMNGDPRIAYKYANQELLEWWSRNGGRNPLWELEAKYGRVDSVTLSKRRLTEDKARTLAQELLGKNRREAMARRGAEQRRARRLDGR